MAFVPNRLLDLAPNIGQVFSSVRFDVLDVNLEVAGVIHPTVSASIQNRTTAPIMRTLRGLQLRADEANGIDLFSARIKPWWVLEDGTEWPLGVFLFAQPDRLLRTWESPLTTTLLDQNYVLDQETLETFGLSARDLVTDGMVAAVQAAGINITQIEPSDVRVLDPVVWPAGTSRLTILSDLAVLAGYARPYFDNDGTLILGPLPSLTETDSTIPYRIDNQAPSRVLVDSVIISESVDAPGAHLVVNNGATKGDISAVAYVHPDLPWSRERRGFLISETHRIQGIESTVAAQRIADSFASQSPDRSITFDSVVDPRHDTYDVVAFGDSDDLYLETAWSMDLEPGGIMSHELAQGVIL